MQRTTKITLAILVLAFAPAAWADHHENPLEGTSEAWIEAFNNADAAAVAAMYSEDAAVMPPNSEPVQGREAIEGFWAAAMATGLEASLVVVESEVDGGLGYKVGTFELHDSHGEVVDHGKFVEIWKDVDGTWLMYRDIYNSSMPLPDAEATPEH